MAKNSITPFGLMVKQALWEKEMTQTELAKELGITKQYLYMILRGKRPPGKYLSEIEKFCYSTLPVDREGRRRLQRHELTSFGCMVKNALQEQEMTQVELAEKIGTTKQYLCLVLHGNRSGRKYISRIAEICKIDLETLTIDKNKNGGRKK